MTGPLSTSRWKTARSFPRFAVDLPLQVKRAQQTGTLQCRTVDIGLGGLCGATGSEILPVGERVQLMFALARDGPEIAVTAKVRYSLPPRHGFQFLNLSPEQRERIRHACEALTIV